MQNITKAKYWVGGKHELMNSRKKEVDHMKNSVCL